MGETGNGESHHWSTSSFYKQRNRQLIRDDKEKLDPQSCHRLLTKLANGGASDIEGGSDDEVNPQAEFELFEEHAENDGEAVLPAAETFVEIGNTVDVEAEASNNVSARKQRIPTKNPRSDGWGWRKQQFIPDVHAFCGETLSKEEILTPYQYFSRYFPIEIFDTMAEQSNIYCLTETGRDLQASRLDIQKLIGIHIHMGTLNYPRVEMYWSPNSRNDMISTCMSLKRFFRLRNNLHVITERQDGCTNVFWKVQPIVDSFLAQCHRLTIEECVCVDEQIIPFRGNFCNKVYIKSKPTPWGIKAYLLCGKSGIVHNMLLYQGTTTEMSPAIKTEFGEAAGTVITLADVLPDNCNYQLFCDNYFTTMKLLQHLITRSIYCTGTVRAIRLGKNPPLTDKAKFEKTVRGTSEEMVNRDGSVVVTQWMDNRTVTVASSKIGIGLEDKCQRFCKKSKSKIEVSRPQCIREYNQSMGGVDLMDFLMSLYRCRIRSVKWTLRVIFHFVDLAVCNSWLEYRQQSHLANIPPKEVLDLKGFRDNIAEALIYVGANPKKGRPSPTAPPPPKRRKVKETRPVTDVRYDQIGHFPEFVDSHSSNRCKNEKCKGHSKIRCSKCNVFLCISSKSNCFIKFHGK